MFVTFSIVFAHVRFCLSLSPLSIFFLTLSSVFSVCCLSRHEHTRGHIQISTTYRATFLITFESTSGSNVHGHEHTQII